MLAPRFIFGSAYPQNRYIFIIFDDDARPLTQIKKRTLGMRFTGNVAASHGRHFPDLLQDNE